MYIGTIVLLCLIVLLILGFGYVQSSYLQKLRRGEGGMEEHEYARMQMNQDLEERDP